MQIQFEFDVRTVALFVGMTFFVQAGAIGAQAFLIRELKQYRGVGAALLANLSVAVCLLLRLFADQLPSFLILIVSNILLLMGPALFYIALSQFTGFNYSKAYLVGVIATVLFFLLYFSYGQDDMGNRIIILSLGSIAIVSILIYQLWRIQNTSLRFSANLMLVSFLFHGMVLIVRTISMILHPLRDTSSLSPVQSATYLLSFALSFFWSMGFILMVSQRLRNDLMEVATVDVLTRIPNRRATQGFLEKELSRAQRNESEFSVLLIDIDNFKQVNDRWGHSFGDHVLVATADILQSMIRKQDWVGRWGGEEFLMIVTGDCEAEALAERVRREIANAKYSHGSTSFGITISIGVACARQSDRIDQILKNADSALYSAKRTKNAVQVAN
ncbi:MAG TPA: diguanylate cyclase [Anaerolineales bacterium]|nr:diguanylate cyclase [Anaerolineales bacterium]